MGIPSLRIIVLLTPLMAILGCKSPDHVAALTEFRRKNPDEARLYKYVYPITLDTFRVMLGDKYASVADIALTLKERFGDTTTVKAYAENVLNRQAKERRQSIDHLRDLEGAASGGGFVCQFEWSDGKTREIGLLVIKSGTVIKREVWSVDYLSNEKETSRKEE